MENLSKPFWGPDGKEKGLNSENLNG